jgi:type I restriction enzyme, S subunit
MNEQWSRVSLGEIIHLERRPVKVEPEKVYQEIGIYCFGRGIFHKPARTGLEVGDKSLFLLKEGDFIPQVTFAWEGAVAIVSSTEDGMYGSTRFPTFRVNESRCVPTFLLNYFKTAGGLQQLVKICPGSAGRNRVLSIKRIPEVLVPLPPLSEQRRVVARVEELASQIDEVRSLRQQAIEEAEALFEASVGKRFGALSNLPTRKLETLTTKIGSGSTPLGGRASYPTSGVPFIRSLNVRMRHFQWDGIAFISEETHKSMGGTCVRPRDVLLNITGASIGRVACAPDDLDRANVNQHVAIIRPTDELQSRYLMYWLSQPVIQEFINDEQKGATRQGFTKTQIQIFEIPLPTLAEQRRIVAELDALQADVDALMRLQTETAAELDALMPSILSKAFAGEL